MPYDEQGNWVEEDDSESPIAVSEAPPEPEEGKQTDIGEYIRRARLGGIGSGSLGTPYPEMGERTVAPQVPKPELYKPGEKMQAYEASVGHEPLHGDYKPSKWRSVLSTIAGIGSGIAFGPDAGQHVQETIRDSPYRRKLQDYQQKETELGRSAQLEAGGNQAARQYYLDLAKVQHENAQSRAEEARRQAEASHGRLWDYQATPEHDRLVHPGAVQAPLKITTSDGKKQYGYLQPGGAAKIGDTLIPPDQITNIERIGTGGASEPLEKVVGDDGKITWMPRSQASGKTAPGEAQGGLDLQTATDIKKRHPDWNMEQVRHAVAVAAEQPQRPPQVLMVPPGGGTAVNVRPGTNVPAGMVTPTQEGTLNSPTSATRGRAQQADVVIETGKELKQFILANKDRLGNIDNYWKNFVNGTPMSDPLISEFQTKLASYAALQAAAHGFRGSNVMTDFEHKIGGAQKNPDALIGAINGIESTMQELKKSGGANYGSSGPSGSSLPGGVTIDEINAELARRKHGRP